MTSQTRKIIAVDVDDVLAANAQAFVEFSNQRWGTNLTVDDYDDDWALLWGFNVELEEHRALIYDRSTELFEHTISTMSHIQGAYEALRRLKEHFDLVVVTSRRTQLKGDTLAWIKEKYTGIFEEDKIFFAGFYDTIEADSAYRNKGDIVRDLKASYLIDDQVRHCNGAAERGIKGLLFGGYAWHAHSTVHPDVTPVKDWNEVVEFFDAEVERLSREG